MPPIFGGNPSIATERHLGPQEAPLATEKSVIAPSPFFFSSLDALAFKWRLLFD